MIDLSKEVNSILRSYANEVEKTLLNVEDEVAEEAIEKLKKTSPKKTRGKKAGHYAKSWEVDKKTKKQYAQSVIHNKDYQLTHLLEHGHDIVRNGKVVGHASPQVHIKPVEDWVKKEMVERIEQDL